jgi:hypothetical protein
MATSESITRFFERLGFELRNSRTSWGATNGEAVMLRTWDDEIRPNPWRVRVFANQPRKEKAQRIGRAERKAHLRAAWAGDIPVYTVIVTPKFDNKGDRRIGDFRTDKVFPIERFVEEDNSIYAVYGTPIAVEQLKEHIGTYRIAPMPSATPQALLDAEGQMPANSAEKATYLAAETREFLIEAARVGEKVVYGDLFDEFDLNRMTVGPVLGAVGHECLSRNEPVITALVVYKDGELKGRCGPGFKEEFNVDEDEERARIFEHWGAPRTEVEVRHRVEWTDEELQASVACYREMMLLDAASKPYVKAHYYRQLAERFNRVEGAFERRMQNISYLLDTRGLEWLHGLKPQENVGVNVEPRLLAFLEELITELTPQLTFPEEVTDLQGVVEGAKKQIVVNAYERDPTAKPRCVKKWGCLCVVCGFNFEAVYGNLGKNFIHVHHLKPIHTIGEAYVLDPEVDLRPVCPNCHSMLHRTKAVISIAELIGLLKWRFDGSPKAIK